MRLSDVWCCWGGRMATFFLTWGLCARRHLLSRFAQQVCEAYVPLRAQRCGSFPTKEEGCHSTHTKHYTRNRARTSFLDIATFLSVKIATFAHSMCKALYAKHPALTYDSPTHSSVCIVLEKIQKKTEKFKKTPCQSFLHGVY